MVKVIEETETPSIETRPVSYLLLEDGTLFKGYSFGANRDGEGEIVFSTGMTGYVESLTDPSYKNQLLTCTYPLIGNYGVPDIENDKYNLSKNFESEKIHAAALIVGEYCEKYSHWNAVKSLSQWLVEQDIPAIDGIDTRQLTKILREKGTMLAKVNINIFFCYFCLFTCYFKSYCGCIRSILTPKHRRSTSQRLFLIPTTLTWLIWSPQRGSRCTTQRASLKWLHSTMA